MEKLILVPNYNSSPSKIKIWKHCKTNKLSLWEDWFSMDKNWWGFDLILIDPNEKIKDGDLVYSLPKNIIFKVKCKQNTTTGVILIEDDCINTLNINEADCKKIVLINDQFTNKYIQNYIDNCNKKSQNYNL